jgi:uncharacterized membrane protein YidH (DUF202 family)
MLKLTHDLQPSEQTHASPTASAPEPTEVTPEALPAFQATQDRDPDFGQVCAYLSNERTFLAWAWTGMMLMGFGVAVAKMRIAISDFSQSTGSLLQSSGKHEISPITMGILFLVVGLITILMSAYRYLVVQNQLRARKYHHSDSFVLIFLLALTLLSGTLIVHVLQLREAIQ